MAVFDSENTLDTVEEEPILTAQTILDALREGLPANSASRAAVSELGDSLSAVTVARKRHDDAERAELEGFHVYNEAQKALTAARSDVRRECKRVREAVAALYRAGVDALPADAFEADDAEPETTASVDIHADEPVARPAHGNVIFDDADKSDVAVLEAADSGDVVEATYDPNLADSVEF